MGTGKLPGAPEDLLSQSLEQEEPVLPTQRSFWKHRNQIYSQLTPKPTLNSALSWNKLALTEPKHRWFRGSPVRLTQLPLRSTAFIPHYLESSTYEINTSANSRLFRLHQCFLWRPFSVPGSTLVFNIMCFKNKSISWLSILPWEGNVLVLKRSLNPSLHHQSRQSLTGSPASKGTESDLQRD